MVSKVDPVDGAVSVAGPVTVEPARVKGSRFLAHLAPAADEAAIAAVLAVVRERYPDASHHCTGWRLADGRERADDDGEPRDTAGAPILRHLGGAGLVDAVCVVVRWFGGTKLGRGGLVRAYGDAAAAAIAAAELVVHVATTTLVVEHAYDDTAAVESTLHAHVAEAVDVDYAATVTRTVRVPTAGAPALVRDLAEATAGRVDPGRPRR